jgi:hypothetical protein
MPSLQWMLHRFKNMPIQEIPHRISERLKIEQDKRGQYVVPPLPASILQQNIPALPFKIHPTKDLSDDWQQKLHKDAQKIMDGNFCLLSTNFEHADDWGRDPNGSYWPHKKSCRMIDVKHSTDGKDIKPTWELLKMPHLQITAWSAALGNATAEDFTKKCLHSFLDWDKPFQNVLYITGYNISCLLLSWLFIASLCPKIFEERLEEFWQSIHHLLLMLRRYPSLYSSANNHRLAELVALYIYDRIAPDLPLAQAQLHLDEINALIPKLFFPDGVNKEQSFHYQANTLEFLLLTQRISSHYRESLYVDSYLKMSCSFLHSLCDKSGMHFDVGDNDHSFVCREMLEDQCSPIEMSGAIASLYDLDCIPFQWSFGPREVLFDIPPNQYHPSICQQHRHFPMGGYTVLYHPQQKARLLFDHAPLGFQSTGGHGHSDALSIWMSVQGIPIFVDWGTYRYNGDPKYRTQSRSTLSHNTITIDNIDQSEMTGPFLWGRRAECNVQQWNDTEGIVAACHDGFLKSHSVHHHRKISCTTDGFLIEDFFDNPLPNSHQVISRLLLHEDIHVEISKERPQNCTLIHSALALALELTGNATFSCERSTYAPKYYQMQETNLISIHGNLPYSILIKL